MGAGTSHANGELIMSQETCAQMCSYPDGMHERRRKRRLEKYSAFAMSRYCIVEKDEAWAKVQESIGDGRENGSEKRAIGAMLGLAVGDALGAPVEFQPVKYEGYGVRGMGHEGSNKFCLKAGQWTDDTSMSLCLADSLLTHPEFSPRDLRLRFQNWWQFGYNNAFGYDEPPRSSVGLGGNISQSFTEFVTEDTEFTTAGDRFTSGNGSLMRLAPSALRHWNNAEKAMETAYKQSKTTHQGDEAAECSRLLAFVLCQLISDDGPDKMRKERILGELKENFKSEIYSVNVLADADKEKKHPDNRDFNLADRNWQWKMHRYHYAPGRAKEMPGYVGSYCMDALAMAFHCVWHSTNFEEAVLKAVDIGGDADTVGAITAQIAGALYGVDNIPKHWIEAVQQWDNGGSIAYRAKLLFDLAQKNL